LRFVGVFNRDGGTFRTMDLDAFCAHATQIFAEHGHQLECRQVAGKDLIAELDRAAASGADVLMAGGGDGTMSAAAGVAFRTGIALAVLPAGTMNLFALALNVPFVLEDALVAIAESKIRRVDIATANGRPFVHQYSVGLHTRLVRIRERIIYRSRLGKIWATIRASFSAMIRPPKFQVVLRTATGSEAGQASSVIVSNNPLPDSGLPFAAGLTLGKLGVYVAKPLTLAGVIRLFFEVLLGRWKASPLLFVSEVESVTLTFPRRKSSAQATIDGELVPLEPVVELLSHPAALRVVAPPVGGCGARMTCQSDGSASPPRRSPLARRSIM